MTAQAPVREDSELIHGLQRLVETLESQRRALAQGDDDAFARGLEQAARLRSLIPPVDPAHPQASEAKILLQQAAALHRLVQTQVLLRCADLGSALQRVTDARRVLRGYRRGAAPAGGGPKRCELRA